MGAGVSNKGKASCVWLISSSHNESHHSVVYGPSAPPVNSRGVITLTFLEMHIDCLSDHVDVYDGLPPFSLDEPRASQSFYRLGSFCGKDLSEVGSVTATLGNMLVVIQANLSRDPWLNGFSAKFTVKKCPESCDGNRRCVVSSEGQQCVCAEGWTGIGCDQPLCPNNCSSSLGRGQCNLVSYFSFASFV